MRQPRSCRSTSMTSIVLIIASVGLRTSPYRLNTGMPCTGSRKSGDSTMLSCLSPRRPCWGPKAALSRTSPHAASASSECTSPAVTEAGCARRATRRPASGRRSFASSTRRSMPSFIELEGERVAMVEVRLRQRMAQRPVRERACLVLDHGGQAEAQSSAENAGDLALHLEGTFHAGADPRRRAVERRAALAIARETVGGPFARRRKIELLVRGLAGRAEKQLEAGMAPQPVDALGRARRRN